MAKLIVLSDPTICYLHETCFEVKDANILKAKEWTKIFHTNSNQKGTVVAILTSHKIDFESKDFTRGKKKGYCLLIKGLIQEEDIRIINIYASNNRL